MSVEKPAGKVASRPKRIDHLRVEKLFGYLNYSIPGDKRREDFKDLMIFYGDNGSGKTTLLTLLFCLLSPVTGLGAG